MEVIHSPDVARDYALRLRREGKRIGLVPTMGALHEGHLSLVRLSQESCDATITTIFVNPTQFGANEDFATYPRTLQRDCELLRQEGVSAVFVPSQESMYPPGHSTMVEPPSVANSLEGIFRPSHFCGVATIVLKLFHCVPCDRAIFGRKDYQQWKVIEAMARDLNLGIEIVAGEIIRESDGLAMSSRNRYLSKSQRAQAICLSSALGVASEAVANGQDDVRVLEQAMRESLLGSNASDHAGHPGADKIDYAVIVDADNLQPLPRINRPAVALIAARIGTTRLIDNGLLFPLQN